MSANKRSTAPASDKLAYKGDEPDEDIPDLSTPYWQERIAAVPVTRGRPKLAAPKVSVTLRLDPDVLAKFRDTGPGWQTRINAALRAAKP
ncbi:MAG: hypothetical protein BWX69_03064 [Planctomycetes bacterium ADurb.Bin069]|nr:MAG: hypothetical protein BWX69_03064 [Planctomycetes bacterium ADurb.Bin069]